MELPKTTSFTDFAHYLKLQRGLSSNTVNSYLSDLKLFEKNTSHSLLTVSTNLIEIYLEQRIKANINRRTLARLVSALKAFFEYALQERLRSDNPAKSIEVKLGSRTLPNPVLSTEEINSLLSVYEQSPKKDKIILTEALLIRMLYATGLRVSELCHLKLSQIDWGSGVLRLQGKGNKTRLVPFDIQTLKELKQYTEQIRPQNQKLNSESKELFLSRRGTAFTRQALWKIVSKHAKLAGIHKPLSPHGLRHAFATHLLENGMNLRSLQMLLGHSDISTTEIYSHLSNDFLRETLEKHHPKGQRAKTTKSG